jgi:hypothetical protein
MNANKDFVVLGNGPFQVRDFENLPQSGFAVDGGSHVRKYDSRDLPGLI